MMNLRTHLKYFGVAILFLVILSLTMFSVIAQPSPSNNPEFNEGYTLTLELIPDHERASNLTIHSGVYDSATGVRINDSNCTISIFNYDGESVVYEKDGFIHDKGPLTVNETAFNETGEYKAELWCHNTDDTKGGYAVEKFKVIETNKISSWSCPEKGDWTFEIIYITLSILIIIAGLVFIIPFVSVIGGVMLSLSYFMIGACNPLLLFPIVIIGLLIAYRFALE